MHMSTVVLIRVALGISVFLFTFQYVTVFICELVSVCDYVFVISGIAPDSSVPYVFICVIC